MIMKAFRDIELSRLGMGNMRLPSSAPGVPNAPIDWPEAHKIIDRAYEAGINYFDTAYVYNNGESERCLGACMTKHPRDSFYLATKWHMSANPDYKAVFAQQLERLQTDHIDFYLIHCILDNTADEYIASGGIEYFLEMQKQGKIRYLGFSSHASPETLARFADHHKWDFAQIQLNYFDWQYSTAKEEYEILASRNIPIVVMEPVRGGRLAQLSSEAEEVLKAAHPDWSIASWALRFVRSKPAVQVILSGMSTMGQMEDNLSTFAADEPFTAEDEATLLKAVDLFKKQVSVPCTGCRYCCDDCPMQINIPEYLKVYNAFKVDGRGALREAEKVESQGKPSDCIGCGMCASLCPQGIDIPKYIAELAAELEKK